MQSRPRRRKRILLVDDEVQNLELLEACLEPFEHEAVRAQAGTEALAFLDRAAFDLVLLDVMMPGATGFEVLRRFREKKTERCVPVILLSALTDRGSRLRGLELGANDFLTKPLDRGELIARVRTLFSLQDATDDLIERTQQMRQLQRLQSDLSSFLVHDLKGPLAAIDGNLTWLRESAFQPEQREVIEDSRECTRRMLGMISELLEIAKTENSLAIVRELAPESLRELADEVAHERERSAKSRQVQLEVRGDPASRTAIDRRLVRRALENLVDNALRHTPAGGRIRIQADPEPTPRLVVSNTGERIAQSDAAHLFDKFGGASAHRRRTGAGLGLYFCKLVMAAHGGEVSLQIGESWPTSFTLSFGPPA